MIDRPPSLRHEIGLRLCLCFRLVHLEQAKAGLLTRSLKSHTARPDTLLFVTIQTICLQLVRISHLHSARRLVVVGVWLELRAPRQAFLSMTFSRRFATNTESWRIGFVLEDGMFAFQIIPTNRVVKVDKRRECFIGRLPSQGCMIDERVAHSR